MTQQFIRCVLFFVFAFILDRSIASEKYLITFTDKKGVEFSPLDYFDEKAIQRRLSSGIPIDDFSDYPVNENYIEAVSKYADSITAISRWLNAVVIYAKDEELARIQSLKFVQSVELLFKSKLNLSSKVASEEGYNLSISNTELLEMQIDRMGGGLFDIKGYTGKGIRVAVFDAGFPNVDKSPFFDHIRAGNRIVKTYDFVKKSEFVYSYSSHGTQTLSCIAGMYNGKKIGMATDAEFLLARTEHSKREPFAEEEFWLLAAEWADKNGANIISSSLGYTSDRYFPEEMNGKKSLVARAANMAAKKGILVLNAAGNEGNDKDWKTIDTPADADSVLSIGGIDPYNGYKSNFSSFGPTSDKRLKPNVCAYGTAITGGSKGFKKADGTSFSTPLVAGFAACAWQAKPMLSNMQLFAEIQKSADLYPYFDYAHGYGVPQSAYFTQILSDSVTPTFELVQESSVLKVVIKEDFLKNNEDMFFDFKKLKKASDSNLLYYHIENSKGYLDKYYVVSVYQKNPVQIIIGEQSRGSTLRVFYKGYFKTYSF